MKQQNCGGAKCPSCLAVDTEHSTPGQPAWVCARTLTAVPPETMTGVQRDDASHELPGQPTPHVCQLCNHPINCECITRPSADTATLRRKRAASWLHEQYGEHTQPDSVRVTSLLAAVDGTQ